MHWNYTVTMILSFSIFIAGAIGAFRFAQIHNIYRPFIYLMWVGCITEVLSVYFAYHYHNNLPIIIIYSLCESLLLLWFFSKLGIFRGQRKLLYFLFGLFIATWLIDNFLGGDFGMKYSFYFDIICALFIVFLSIGAINELLFTERELLKNPTFLICIGLITFFTYQIIQRLFGLYGLKDSLDFRRSIQRILSVINCLTNLLFALAIIWMRKRRPFSLRF